MVPIYQIYKASNISFENEFVLIQSNSYSSQNMILISSILYGFYLLEIIIGRTIQILPLLSD